ncbi:winged helix DNA-binding domain-containing protein [Streptosporangium sp. NPDC048047]|uniref:winged helix DNA-binding domain-containing protein n=1 Tax=Streptosporangium sp. NPDC048047 TaxID=3155748 RepID=UPI003421BE90
MPEVLGVRALNRATLERQLLLRRSPLTALEAVRHLYGMQAQAPDPPYVGLWSRLAGFTHEELSDLLRERRVVRLALMRSTIHLVAAEDCLALRPLLQPVLDRVLRGPVGRRLAGLEVAEAEEAGRALVEERPLTFAELGSLLRERWPQVAAADLVHVVRARVALVQVPPRGIWGVGGKPAHTSAEAWLGRPLEGAGGLGALAGMVRRYLAAYGPATVMDLQQWSGLTRLGEVVEGMGLRSFVTVDGARLVDLPEAPRPDPDVVAPVRYLAEFDNTLLSFAERTRTRMMAEDHRGRVFTVNGIIRATVLVDGFVRGMWAVRRSRGAAVLEVELFGPVPAAARAELEGEGMRMLDFLAPAAVSREVRLV